MPPKGREKKFISPKDAPMAPGGRGQGRVSRVRAGLAKVKVEGLGRFDQK
jgi:hypothetical protein